MTASIALKKRKMNELCDITSSKRIFKADYQKEGVPFYRAKEISEKHKGAKSVSDKLFISREKFESIKAKFGSPVDGDLLLTSIGALLGEPYVVKNDGDFYFKDGNLTWFKNFRNLDPTFLYYWMLSPEGKAELNKSIIGAAQPAFTIVKLKGMEINLPELVKQEEVISVLQTYDNLIENNNRRIAILEEMAQSLYREWFIKFRFPGHENTKFIDSPLGKIPEGWEVKTLDDFCLKVIDGTHDSPKPTEEGFYLVTGKHIKNGFIDFTNAYLITEEEHNKVMARSKPEKGDILFSNIGTLGSTTIVDQNFEYSIKNVALFKPQNKQSTYFLYLYATNKSTIGSMLSQASGTSQKFLSLKFLRGYKLVIPRDEILVEFHENVEPLFGLRSTLSRKNSNLKEQRDLLLPKLISGSINLKN